jgi:hypothetical protein
MIAGQARIYRAARRTALGDRVRGARRRLARKISVRPDVLRHRGSAMMSRARIGGGLLRVNEILPGEQPPIMDRGLLRRSGRNPSLNGPTARSCATNLITC